MKLIKGVLMLIGALVVIAAIGGAGSGGHRRSASSWSAPSEVETRCGSYNGNYTCNTQMR